MMRPDEGAQYGRFWIAPATLLVIALVFGGGTYQQSWPDSVVQLASLPVLWLTLRTIPSIWSGAQIRTALLLSIAIVAVPVLQLLPLPPGVWTKIPGREFIVRGFQEAGLQLPWFPISLSPAETWRSALSLIPPLTMFLATLCLDLRGRRVLSLLLIGFGFLSVLIGLAQVAGGPTSPLRLYHGGSSSAEGFFLNRNHYAALLYSLIPLSAAWVVGLAADRRSEMVMGIILLVIVFASLMLGLGIAQSRAGVVLAILAALTSVGLARTGASSAAVTASRARKIVLVAGSIGALLIFQFGLIGLLQRMEADPLKDGRWQFTEVTLHAAKDFFPFGSGFGTFDSVYEMYEDLEMLAPTFVNNAHNDLAEILLEGGLVAAVVLVFFVIWFVTNLVRIWRPSSNRASALDISLARAGSISAILLLLHSLVDYPLRSAALSCLLAYTCGLLLPPNKATAAAESTRRSARQTVSARSGAGEVRSP